ncbi:MAG: NUDIX domain-containing protein [Saprospiraceae bacterium]
MQGKIIDALSIDCVIFGFKHSSLYVLLVKHKTGKIKNCWKLPGGWIQYDESIHESAKRILKLQSGVENLYLEQFKTFGKVERFPNKRVITIVYYALLDIENFTAPSPPEDIEVSWVRINEIPEMLYDHNHIFENCLFFLKHKVQHEPIGFNLLPEKFTLLQLQELYEAILNQTLDKSNFRKKLLKMSLLVDTNEKQKFVSHRAARLYSFDKKVYDRLLNQGFIFELN